MGRSRQPLGPAEKHRPQEGPRWDLAVLTTLLSGSDNPFSSPSLATPCSELLPQVILPQRRPHGYSHGPSGATFSHQASPSSRMTRLCKHGLSLVTPPHLLPTERVVLGFVTLPLPGRIQDGTGIQVHTHTAS